MRPRFDERDTIFSRMELVPGSGRYQEYYANNPEKDDVDRSLREAPSGEFSHHILENHFIDETFGLLAEMRQFVRGPVVDKPSDIKPEEAAVFLKHNALKQGAVLTGFTESREKLFYGIRGRGERYGKSVDDYLPCIIVFVFEMDKEEIRQAPEPRQSAEVVRTYLKAASTALSTARFIRSLGWEAVAHIDGESEVVLPPAAAAAGLGEIGRHGLLVTKKYGSRVRLSAVTTSLPLPADMPTHVVSGGLSSFCDSCGKCIAACPSGAISPEISGGNVNHEACFGTWKRFGTDCGICLAVCPFSGIH
ncbi:MAG: 4Fe-4S binding protein [Spirochaetaceae bacterium]|nr:4Fe-4S binding protein [Spirochaetaceae bacterium]